MSSTSSLPLPDFHNFLRSCDQMPGQGQRKWGCQVGTYLQPQIFATMEVKSSSSNDFLLLCRCTPRFSERPPSLPVKKAQASSSCLCTSNQWGAWCNNQPFSADPKMNSEFHFMKFLITNQKSERVDFCCCYLQGVQGVSTRSAPKETLIRPSKMHL